MTQSLAPMRTPQEQPGCSIPNADITQLCQLAYLCGIPPEPTHGRHTAKLFMCAKSSTTSRPGIRAPWWHWRRQYTLSSGFTFAVPARDCACHFVSLCRYQTVCHSTTAFSAHLVNQGVTHKLIAFQILVLQTDSIENRRWFHPQSWCFSTGRAVLL
jgi:hypothetical protein